MQELFAYRRIGTAIAQPLFSALALNDSRSPFIESLLALNDNAALTDASPACSPRRMSLFVRTVILQSRYRFWNLFFGRWRAMAALLASAYLFLVLASCFRESFTHVDQIRQSFSSRSCCKVTLSRPTVRAVLYRVNCANFCIVEMSEKYLPR